MYLAQLFILFFHATQVVLAEVPPTEPPADGSSATKIEELLVPKKLDGIGRRGWAFVTLYSTADEIKSEGKFTVGSREVDFTQTDTASATPGFGAFYHHPKRHRWGWINGATYELKRRIDAFDISTSSAGASGFYDSPNPYLYLLTAASNASLTLSPVVFLYAGANYSLPFYGEVSEKLKTSGLLGYQVGVSLDMSSRVQLEFEYRVARHTLKGTTFIDTQGERTELDIDTIAKVTGLQGHLKFFY